MQKNISGFSTIELLVYAVGMVAILAVIFYLIVNMYSYYGKLTATPRVNRVASLVLDRIVRDVRSGQSINLSESQFESNTGSITVNAQSGETELIKKFAYDNGRITYQIDSGDVNYLTPDDLSVSKFFLTQLESPVSEGVRIEIEFTYKTGDEQQARKFSSFVILRHSYE